MARDAPERDKPKDSGRRLRLLVHIQRHVDDGVTASALAEETGVSLVVVQAELEYLATVGRLSRRVAEDGGPRYTPAGRKKLSELLVEAGLITEQQLQDALAEQAKTGDRLGRILVERGYMPKQTLGEILETQRGLPEWVITQHKVLPIVREGGEVHLAMLDPTDVIAIDTVATLLEARVRPLLTTERDFDWAMTRFFDVGRRVGESLAGAPESLLQIGLKSPSIAHNLPSVAHHLTSGGRHDQPSVSVGGWRSM